MNSILLALIFATGAAGIAAQILLLRELLVSFNGNELTIGIILSNWVIAEALGVICGGAIASSLRRTSEANDEAIPKFRDCFVAKDAPRNDLILFVGAQVLFFISLFCALYLSRVFKNLFGIGFGEAAGIGGAFFSFLIIFVPAFIHGELFSLGCDYYARLRGGLSAALGRVYAWETFGTLAGGLGLAYFFIPWLDPFGAVFIVSVPVFLICLLLILCARSGRILFFIVCVLFLVYFLYGSSAVERLQKYSLKKQWFGYHLLESFNTIYGNISVTEQPQQYTFYYDGLPQATTPNPDLQFVGDFGNLPLLFQAAPRDILVIGAGAGGLLRQILNHNVLSVDYSEMDPAVITALRKYPSRLTAGELGDRRVRLIYSDGRYYIRSTSKKYDIILVGLSAPADLAANRMFTSEFYASAAKRLNAGGIIAFWLPRQEAYMGREQARATAAIMNAFKNNFLYTRVIPGDYYAIFLGSNVLDIKGVTTSTLENRIQEQHIENASLSPAYLDYLFNPDRENEFLSRLPLEPCVINSDRRPVAVFDMCLYQGNKFFRLPPGLIAYVEKLGPYSVCVLAALPFLLLPLFFSRRRGTKMAVFYSLMTTGFFGMLSSLCLMFVFQAWYGCIYYALSLFIAVFMAGAGTGGILVTKRLPRIKRVYNSFIALESAIMVFCLILGYLVGVEVITSFVLLSFAALFFLSGFLVGLQFPLAAALFGRFGSAGKVSAILYGADLAGGWFAGALGGIILLPVAGLLNTCLLMGLLKFSSLIWVVSARYKK